MLNAHCSMKLRWAKEAKKMPIGMSICLVRGAGTAHCAVPAS
jgi:hypothetical protein